MSIFRKDSSPPEGSSATSKLSLLKSHLHSATGGGVGGSISIRFNPSSSIDDEDDTGEGITVLTTAETSPLPAATEENHGGGVVGVNNSSSLNNTSSPMSSSRNTREGRQSQATNYNTPQTGEATEQHHNPSFNGRATGAGSTVSRKSPQHQQEVAGVASSARFAPVSKGSPLDMESTSMDAGSTTRLAGGSLDYKPHTKTKDHSRIYSRNQDSDEKVSILSGIKERLQDKFHDNLTAVIGKIEEISGDSKLGEALERRLKKGDSFDSSSGSRTTSSHYHKTNGSGTSLKRSVDGSGTKSREESRSRHNSASSSNTVASEVFEECDSVLGAVGGGSGGLVSASCSTEAVASGSRGSVYVGATLESQQEEEVFATDLVEEKKSFARKKPQQQQRPSSTSGVESSSNDMSQIPMKGRKEGGQQFASLESSQSVPVSMSALLSHTDADMEEEEVGVECDQEFFDLQDQEHAKRIGTKEQTSDGENLQSTDENVVATEKTEPSSQLKLPFNIAFSRQNILSILVALVAILFLPLPSFVSGVLIGGFLGACSLSVFQWVTRPLKPKELINIPDIRKQPPLTVPYMKESKNDDGKFKGWVNELPFYDQTTYHISNTKSVYIQLEGTNLRLQTPKTGIPKRALWSEPKLFPTSFIKQRFLNLTECTVSLVPEGLVSKRIWSKKYPICIMSSKKDCNAKKKAESNLPSPNLEEARQLGFDSISGEVSANTKCVYLFARTCREKEEWFHRLVAASKGKPLCTSLSELITKANARCIVHKSGSSALLSSLEPSHRLSNKLQFQHQQQARRGSCDSTHSETYSNIELEVLADSERVTQEYIRYMTRLMPDARGNRSQNPKKTDKSPTRSQKDESGFVSITNTVECDSTILWTNALLGRLFFDFLREQYWADKVRTKIQGKLSKIHVPYFIDKLTVTGIELGSQVPVIQRISRPYLDERGTWFDLDIAYSGGFAMTLETKVNLMKLKKSGDRLETKQESVKLGAHKVSAVTDSGEEDSAESSTDEETEEEYTEERLVQAEPARKKLLKMVDKIAASKYFQQATENKYIKKAMEGVSNTRLVLTVEMKSCVGTMVLNIPPPPTDRLWYGFRKNPSLVLCAKPRVGQREVSMAHIVEWIENKLALEFQRVLVLPNMDDMEIPLMCGHLTESDEMEEEAERVLVMPNMEDEVIPLLCDPVSRSRPQNLVSKSK